MLASRPVPAEVRLEYSGLREVLDPLSDAVGALPRPQQSALRAALGVEPSGPGGGPQLVAAAAGTLLRDAAARGPVLVAVDDLQWLDPSSRQAIASACRRTPGRLAILTSARTSDTPAGGEEVPVAVIEPADPRSLTHLPLAPLTPADVTTVARAVAGRPLAAATMERLVEAADGNPLFAVQLAEHWRSRPAPDGLPASLRALVAERLSALPRATRDLLLTAACLADARVDALAAVHGDVEAVAAAEDAGVAQVAEGRLRFAHPLFALGVLDAAPPGRRRERHRRLADVAGGAADDEARARHLAHAAVGPEPVTVAALDTAADAAAAAAGRAGPARHGRLRPCARARVRGAARAHETARAGARAGHGRPGPVPARRHRGGGGRTPRRPPAGRGRRRAARLRLRRPGDLPPQLRPARGRPRGASRGRSRSPLGSSFDGRRRAGRAARRSRRDRPARGPRLPRPHRGPRAGAGAPTGSAPRSAGRP